MGFWIRLLPAVIASMAFMCSVLYGFYCESFRLEPKNGGDAVRFGPWYAFDTQLVETGLSDENGQPYYTTQSSCVNIDGKMDSKAKTTRAFTVIVALWGGLITAAIWMAPCLYMVSESQWRLLAFQFVFILPLFQGLTFLLLESDICNGDQWEYAQPGCKWDGGATANVFSIVLWFLTGAAMVVVGVPVRPVRPPPETQTVTYQKTDNPDGTTTVNEVKVVKGTAVPVSDAASKPPQAESA